MGLLLNPPPLNPSCPPQRQTFRHRKIAPRLVAISYPDCGSRFERKTLRSFLCSRTSDDGADCDSHQCLIGVSVRRTQCYIPISFQFKLPLLQFHWVFRFPETKRMGVGISDVGLSL